MGPTKLSIGCTTQALRNCLDLRARTGQGRKFRSTGWGCRNRLIGTVGSQWIWKNDFLDESWWIDFCTRWYWRIFGTMIIFQCILLFMVSILNGQSLLPFERFDPRLPHTAPKGKKHCTLPAGISRMLINIHMYGMIYTNTNIYTLYLYIHKYRLFCKVFQGNVQPMAPHFFPGFTIGKFPPGVKAMRRMGHAFSALNRYEETRAGILPSATKGQQ